MQSTRVWILLPLPDPHMRTCMLWPFWLRGITHIPLVVFPPNLFYSLPPQIWWVFLVRRPVLALPRTGCGVLARDGRARRTGSFLSAFPPLEVLS